MKILYVITSLRVGGAEKISVELLKRFKEQGDTVELALFDGSSTSLSNEIERAGIKIHCFYKGYRHMWNPANIFKLKRLINNNRFDIIHSHNFTPQLFSAIVKRDNTLLITTEHNTVNRRRNIPLLRYLDRWMYGKYDWVITVNKSTLNNLRAFTDNNSLNNKCSVIHNGIVLNKPSENSKNILKHKNEIVILMVAGFRKQKDQPTLIKAMTKLPNKYKLKLAGTGARLSYCRALAGKLGLTDRVEFLGLRNDVPTLLEQADILVLSSHYEGLPLSGIECMAAGKPFIASAVPGLKETVEGAALLFNEGDYRHLAQIIKNVGDDVLYANTIAQACLSRAHEYNIENTFKGYNSLYRQLLENI